MKKIQKTKMPRSRATTAFGLLNDVVAAIRAEPKRLYMPGWILDTKMFLRVFRSHRKPPCNTAGCVAGWIVLMHDGRKRAYATMKADVVGDRASALLGLTYGETYELFRADVRDDDGTDLKPFTRAYVEAVVDRIRYFQGQHAAALKAQQLPE